MFADHRESEDQVEDIVDSEAGEVAISGRVHRLASQHHNVNDVADTAERDDWWNEHLEGYCLDQVQQQTTFFECDVILLLLMRSICPRSVQHSELVAAAAIVSSTCSPLSCLQQQVTGSV